MKTRIKDLSAGYSFQYGEGKHPEWQHIGGNAAPLTWKSKTQRDLARAIFSRRRTVDRALGDLCQRKLA